MSRQAFERGMTELLQAIHVLSKSQLRLPAMLVLYAGIDIMASLDRPESSVKVKRSDFLNWSDKYLLPDTRLACSAHDLYAARCGLLHAYIAESQLSREEKAKQVWYAWGDGRAADLQAIIDRADVPVAVAVHFDDLAAAFSVGIERFTQSLLDDPQKAKRVYDRAHKFFGNLPVLSRLPDGP